MDLLPNDFAEFRSKTFWDSFFQKRKSVPFEWYGEWAELKGIIGSVCKITENVLVIGCGNSELSAHMYDAGFTQITNVDFSKLVIMEMLKKHVRARPCMRWLVMDMTKMTFADGSYDVVVDKGGLDALMGEEGEAGSAAGINLLDEVERVLRSKGGRYLCVTLAQEHVIELVMQRYRQGWQLTVHKVPQPPGSKPSALQPFLVVATRTASEEQAAEDLPLVTLTFQQTASEGMDPDQMTELLASVKRENNARRQGLTGRPTPVPLRRRSPGRREQRQLAAAGRGTGGRFTAVILDAPEEAEGEKRSLECAVFLVPQGREHEWLFATEEGQWQLVESTGAARVILVSLNRGHDFGSSLDVQAELSPLVLPLAPEGCRDGRSHIPFMTTGDGIGKRLLLEEVESPLTGSVLVEDVDLRGSTDPPPCPLLRRLIFKRSPTLIQSEAALVEHSSNGRTAESPAPSTPENLTSVPAPGSGKKKKKAAKKGSGKVVENAAGVEGDTGVAPVGESEGCGSSGGLGAIDHSYLASEYHVAILAGLSLLAPQLATWQDASVPVKVLLVGLGGGALPMFLRRHLPFLHIKVAELDSVVGEVARRHFGFTEDLNLTLEITDGIAAVQAIANATDSFQVAAREAASCCDRTGPAGNATVDVEGQEGAGWARGEAGSGGRSSASMPGSSARIDERAGANLGSGRAAASLQSLRVAGGAAKNQQVAEGEELAADPRLHLLIVDADSDDPNRVGMTCPPPAFLEASFLSAARKALHNDGMLLLNVVARSAAPYAAAKAALLQAFEELYEVDVDEDINRVLLALPQTRSAVGVPCGVSSVAADFLSMIEGQENWTQSAVFKQYAETLRLLPAGL